MSDFTSTQQRILNGQQAANQTENDNKTMKAQLETRPNIIVEAHKSLFEGLDVTRALLHQSIDIPNGGGSVASLYSKPGPGLGRSAITGIKMKYNQDGLFCEYKGSAFVVPLANVVCAYLG